MLKDSNQDTAPTQLEAQLRVVHNYSGKHPGFVAVTAFCTVQYELCLAPGATGLCIQVY
jgi:hypothetical protein